MHGRVLEHGLIVVYHDRRAGVSANNVNLGLGW